MRDNIEYHKCNNEQGFCKTLSDRLDPACHHGKGMQPLSVMDMNALVGDSSAIKCVGVLYKTDSKDRGVMFNYCPYCGNKIDWFRKEKDQEATN